MTCASLFSGIGGFDLAAEWMGWEILLQCEINPFAQKVLRYYWPDAELFTDITKTDFTPYAGLIDILTGGFPCQPYSVAGQRRGNEDDRHLWPHMLRAVREIKPRWVVGENVRGLVSWSGGLVFDEVQSDLEAEGYEVMPFLLPACAVGAPHRRDRIWFVAYNATDARLQRPRVSQKQTTGFEQRGESYSTDTANAGAEGVRKPEVCIYGLDDVADTYERTVRTLCRGKTHDGGECQENPDNCNLGRNAITTNTDGLGLRDESNRFGKSGQFGENGAGDYWQNFPTVAPVCDGNDGLSCELDATAVFGKACKPAHARTFSKWRNESIKGGGNAIVPQVVLQIYEAIEMYELLYT